MCCKQLYQSLRINCSLYRLVGTKNEFKNLYKVNSLPNTLTATSQSEKRISVFKNPNQNSFDASDSLTE